MSRLIGQFYYRLTQSGNLLGEFSNNGTLFNWTESADLVREDNKSIDSFEGTYHTTWQEGGNPCFATLIIIPKVTTAGPAINIFELTWTFKNQNQPTFYGEGFISEGILVGSYRNFRNI